MYNIIKCDQFMLTIINRIGYTLTIPQLCLAGSHKITFIFFEHQTLARQNSPILVKHLEHLPPRNLAQHKAKHL